MVASYDRITATKRLDSVGGLSARYDAGFASSKREGYHQDMRTWFSLL